jgi:hypothetical protein
LRYQTGVKAPGGTGVKPTKPNQFLVRLSELTVPTSPPLPTLQAMPHWVETGNWKYKSAASKHQSHLTPTPSKLTGRTRLGPPSYLPYWQIAPRFRQHRRHQRRRLPDLATGELSNNTASILLNITATGPPATPHIRHAKLTSLRQLSPSRSSIATSTATASLFSNANYTSQQRLFHPVQHHPHRAAPPTFAPKLTSLLALTPNPSASATSTATANLT